MSSKLSNQPRRRKAGPLGNKVKKMKQTVSSTGPSSQPRASSLGDEMEKMWQEVSEIDTKKLDSYGRWKLAVRIVALYFSLFILILVYIPVYNVLVQEEVRLDIMGVITCFTSLFGTHMGFILGHYFKDSKEE